MSLHNKAEHNTPDIVVALKQHRLTVDKPSVVSDAFRLGWAAHRSHIKARRLRVLVITTYLVFLLTMILGVIFEKNELIKGEVRELQTD